MTHKLQNYLRTYRKRTGLSQEEVSYLLGCNARVKANRHERSARIPSLDAILAYEAVYGASAGELFAGVYQKVEHDTKRRARTLAQRLAKKEPTPMIQHKLASLGAIAGTVADLSNVTHDISPQTDEARPGD